MYYIGACAHPDRRPSTSLEVCLSLTSDEESTPFLHMFESSHNVMMWTVPLLLAVGLKLGLWLQEKLRKGAGEGGQGLFVGCESVHYLAATHFLPSQFSLLFPSSSILWSSRHAFHSMTFATADGFSTSVAGTTTSSGTHSTHILVSVQPVVDVRRLSYLQSSARLASQPLGLPSLHSLLCKCDLPQLLRKPLKLCPDYFSTSCILR